MNNNRFRLLSLKTVPVLFVLAALFALFFPVSAFDVIPSQDYEFPEGDFLPEVLNVNQVIECGDFSFRLTYPPLVSKSMNSIVGDNDLRYLILRVGITNNREETIGWISPESFSIREVYRNRYYGTYPMDPLMSAKGAKGYSDPAFYSPIKPGETLRTMIVFPVYPEAEYWVMTLTPFIFGEKPGESVVFTLPKANYQ